MSGIPDSEDLPKGYTSISRGSQGGSIMNGGSASGSTSTPTGGSPRGPLTMAPSPSPSPSPGVQSGGSGVGVAKPVVARKPPPPIAPRPVPPKRVVMRLRCRFRSLHDTYFTEGQVSDQDTDVIFQCGDGGRVKAHKIILASSSKYFANVFADQRPGDVSYVSVPDVRSDIMKIIVLMTYKDNVVVTAGQISLVQEFVDLFGINWNNLKPEAPSGDKRLDVKPGRIMESLPKAPPPLMARPSSPQRVSTGQQGQVRMPFQQGGPRYSKPQTSVRGGALQNPGMRPGIKRPIGMRQGLESEVSEEEPESPFQLQGYHPQQHQERRKLKQIPRVETETDDTEDMDMNTDPVEAQKMIKEWMARVGKNDQESKRPRLDDRGPQSGDQNFECTVCNATFQKQSAWKWHEERHVGLGLFKCNLCDQLVKTARAVWGHERQHHGYSSIAAEDLEEPRAIPPNFQLIEGRRHNGPSASGQRNIPGQQPLGANRNLAAMRIAQLRRLKASKIGSMKKVPDRLIPNFNSRNTRIGIGISPGSDQIDIKKIKQLHWLYVCAKCDNCSDSSTKAMAHYKKCYPKAEAEFEATVTKYRQGFYGKSRCPLCPRRYAANGGFMIHCGHIHQDYRKLFSLTGAADDKLKCANCKRKFPFPDEFHDHLDDGIQCTKSPVPEESTSGPTGRNGNNSRSATPATPATPAATVPPPPTTTPAVTPATPAPTPVTTERVKRKIQPSTRISLADYETTPLVPLPRSARLAQRASKKLEASPAPAPEVEPKPVAAMRRASGIDYPPADCPICGASEVANISQHLSTDHQDLNVTVNRISPDLLRCRKCLITFAICDLLAHNNSCSGTDETLKESSANEESTSKSESKAKLEAKPKPVITELPPGVGCSPVDRMENTDLYSKDALRRAMICTVCDRTSIKLGDIATCLRAHGVYRCALCFNSYLDRNDFTAHTRKCHGFQGSNTKLKCPLCSKAFSNAGQTAGHMYSSHWVDLLKEVKRDVAINGIKAIKAGLAKSETDTECRSESEQGQSEKVKLDDSGDKSTESQQSQDSVTAATEDEDEENTDGDNLPGNENGTDVGRDDDGVDVNDDEMNTSTEYQDDDDDESDIKDEMNTSTEDGEGSVVCLSEVMTQPAKQPEGKTDKIETASGEEMKPDLKP